MRDNAMLIFDNEWCSRHCTGQICASVAVPYELNLLKFFGD
jgi:hypothetical protein